MLQRSVLARNTLFHSLMAVTLILSSACNKPSDPGATIPAPKHLTATDLPEASRFHVADGPCASRLRFTLAGHGHDIALDGHADAILILTLVSHSPLRDSLPLIGGLGVQAQYRAEIQGANHQPMLSIYGQEGSLTFNELCDDIGDEIADKLSAAIIRQRLIQAK